MAPMTADTTAAVEHVRRLGEVDVHLTATELNLGFIFQGKRRILERGVSFWFPKVRRDACLYIRLALRVAYLGVHQRCLAHSAQRSYESAIPSICRFVPISRAASAIMRATCARQSQRSGVSHKFDISHPPYFATP